MHDFSCERNNDPMAFLTEGLFRDINVIPRFSFESGVYETSWIVEIDRLI